LFWGSWVFYCGRHLIRFQTNALYNYLQRNQPQRMITKMTGIRGHPVWTHFVDITSVGKSKRAACKDCTLSIVVALVERMKNPKISCTLPINENNIFEKKYSIYDPVENNSIASTNLRKDSSSNSNFEHSNLNDTN